MIVYSNIVHKTWKISTLADLSITSCFRCALEAVQIELSPQPSSHYESDQRRPGTERHCTRLGEKWQKMSLNVEKQSTLKFVVFPARNTGYGKFRISELNIPSEYWLSVSDGNFCFETIYSWLFEVLFKYLGYFHLHTRLKFFNQANHFKSGESYPHLQNDVPV